MTRFCSVKELRGLKVVGSGGRIFGELEDLELDMGAWRVENLVLRVRRSIVKELGLPRPRWKRAHVSIPARHVRAGQDVVLLDITVEAFADELRAARPLDEPAATKPEEQDSSK